MLPIIPPSFATLDRLRRAMVLTDGAQDVYLAYEGAPQVRLSGVLVAVRGDIDRVIAYCPLAKSAKHGTPAWRTEVLRQFRIACRIAERPESARSASDAVWLGYVATGERAVPNWVYALACVPLTYPWDGELLSPRPFCPSLFERMASQPQAVRWLHNRRPSPLAAAGGAESSPAPPIS